MFVNTLPRIRAMVTVLAMTLALATARVARADSNVYANTLTGTVYIEVGIGNDTGKASGWIVDRDQRLVVTNDHVVDSVNHIDVYFPLYSRPEGKLLTDYPSYPRYYKQHYARGRVLARDRNRDLALIQVDWLPEGVRALPLAPRGVVRGETVYSLGNSGVHTKSAQAATLWRYRQARVLQVAFEKLLFDGRTWREAQFIKTDDGKDHGDSGGPVVNEQGQVVGVVNGGIPAKHLGTSVGLDDLRAFLRQAQVSTPGAPVAQLPTPGLPASPLVGTWRATYQQQGQQMAVNLTFGADGTVVMSGVRTFTGTYTYADGVLTMTVSAGRPEAFVVTWQGPSQFSFFLGRVPITCIRQ